MLAPVGSGIDPMSILVPFLVFAIGVSHGVQLVNAGGVEVREGAAAMDAARTAFRRLIVPGAVALASDCAGFLSILLIEVQIIRVLAITASLGMAAILFTNLLLLPVLISYVSHGERFSARAKAAAKMKRIIWRKLSQAATLRRAIMILLSAIVVTVGANYVSRDLIVGDARDGVPELRPDSRYNQDSGLISERFSIGLDVLTVIVETEQYACVKFPIVDRIDDFAATMQNVPGVSAVISLPQVARRLNASFNEGNPKWNMLPRTSQTLVQSVSPISTQTGLLNVDCSVMPVLIFTENHRVETIDLIIGNIEEYADRYNSESLQFQLATGNVGVMAATNDLIRDTRVNMLIWVYAAVLILCILAFPRCAA